VVRQALLGLGESDPQALESLLSRLVLRLDGPEAAAPGSEARWWAERLLSGTLQRLPDAGVHASLLRTLAARIVYGTNGGDAGGAARPRIVADRAAYPFRAGAPNAGARAAGFRSAVLRSPAAPYADAAGAPNARATVAEVRYATPGSPAAPAAAGPTSAESPYAEAVAPGPASAEAAAAGPSGPLPFLPWDFWRRLPLTVEARLDVLRVLVRGRDGGARAAGAAGAGAASRSGAAALCGWLADGRVSGIAAETLFAHQHVALDELAEALGDAAHPRADALLRALAQAKPSALGRAVDRWAHDPRPERHVAAATVLPLLARQAAHRAPAERTLLRLAAEALLAREDEEALHGAAYAALVSDLVARPKHLRGAVTGYLGGDPLLGAASLAPALDTDPALVLTGYADRLREPGEEAGAVLRALGATPVPRARAAAARLVREYLQRRPEAAAQVGVWMRARLAYGPAERETLVAFARDAAAKQPEPVRWRLTEALADDPGVLARELRGLLHAAVTSPMRIEPQAHGKV
jgi:hypothetical protein